ncbi:hypothetical protein LD85_3037 [Saccharolobus islandicus L.D.8.5]|uniref:Uncharacterized protein n=1 Tax=Saccharolobus islandicus (strain L.D.8.5 / Lassen \|nr:hypothetical protein LD85_3037 [Sulfolobus islandicus L.D.8.5]
MAFNVLLFPAPLGPKRQYTSEFIEKLSELTAIKEPYFTVRFLTLKSII